MAESDYIPADPEPRQHRADPDRNLAVVVYILQALSFFVGGITALAGVIINYVKLDDVRGTLIEDHFRWQIRTFWIGLLWMIVGFVLVFVVVGWLILAGIAIWIIYRIVVGALALNEGRSPRSGERGR